MGLFPETLPSLETQVRNQPEVKGQAYYVPDIWGSTVLATHQNPQVLHFYQTSRKLLCAIGNPHHTGEEQTGSTNSRGQHGNSVCTFICMHVYMHTCVCACVQARHGDECLFPSPSTWFLRPIPLLNLELLRWVRLAGQRVPMNL